MVGSRSDDRQGRSSVDRLEHRIAQVAQAADGEVADVLVVLDDEDGLALLAARNLIGRPMPSGAAAAALSALGK